MRGDLGSASEKSCPAGARRQAHPTPGISPVSANAVTTVLRGMTEAREEDVPRTIPLVIAATVSSRGSDWGLARWLMCGEARDNLGHRIPCPATSTTAE